MAKFNTDHVHIEQWRRPAGRKMRDLLNEVKALIREREPKRTRARRPDDQSRWDKLIDALISDVCYRIYEGQYERIILPRDRHATRYDYPPFKSTNVDELLKICRKNKQGLLTFVKGRTIIRTRGYVERHAPTIAPGRELLALFEKYRPTYEDFKLDPPEVVVVRLKDNAPRDHFLEPTANDATFMDYLDNDRSNRVRTSVREANGFLSSFRTSYGGNRNIDTRNTRVRRIFIQRPTAAEQALMKDNQRLPKAIRREPSLDLCGRFYGGFWQNMERDERHHLFIDGEETCELDYSQFNLRVAYAEAGYEIPLGDLYAIPNLPGERDQIKSFVNAMFNHTRPFTKHYPGGVELPCKPPHAEAMIKKHHHRIAHLFNTGSGLRYMFKESQIMEELFGIAMDRHWPMLPLHDALIVPLSLVDLWGPVMADTMFNLTSADAEVQAKYKGDVIGTYKT